MEIFLISAAFLIDCAIGDPRTRFHPVVIIGTLISLLERLLLGETDSPEDKRRSGALLVIITLFSVYAAAWFITEGLYSLPPIAAFIGNAALLSFTISPRSLAEAGRGIKKCFAANDLAAAREKVSWIVGRDCDKLDTSEITRATVETIAENIVDGVIAPLFYAGIGGVPLAFMYRAVNTLDSMVGYKNDKYRDFGMVSARTDDVFNYIPARITAFLIMIAAFLLRYDWQSTVRTVLRDAKKHPSPNSGYPEAAVAGALGVRLGGLNYYGGVASLRAYMGEAAVSLEPVHINRTIFIMYLVTCLFITLQTLLYWSLGSL